MKKSSLTALLLTGLSSIAMGHHSFAVHFVSDSLVTVEGVVTDFRFTNPHGVLLFTATDDNGNTVEWKAETNSPNVLKRRGWHRDILEPGDVVTVVGFPARNEEHYMRISRVTFADGSQITGQAASLDSALDQD